MVKKYRQPNDKQRLWGDNWLQQLSMGRVDSLAAAERSFLLVRNEVLIMYALIVSGILIYSYANIYFNYALTIIAIVVPGALAWPTLKGLYGSLAEKDEGVRVICIPMGYDFDGEKILITMINSRNLAVLGDLLIAVGWFERKQLSRKLNIVILGRSSIRWTYMIMEKGEIIRIPEGIVREGFAELLRTMNKDQLENAEKYQAKLLFLATDGTYSPPVQELELSGLLTGCDIGFGFEWAKAQLEHERSLWIQEAMIEVHSDSIEPNKSYPMTIKRRTPPLNPTVKEIMFQILEKLEKLSKENDEQETHQ
ncbi:MAG: hypothetical protein WB643_06405 [Candidatus Bathyarchaeia archaeon]